MTASYHAGVGKDGHTLSTRERLAQAMAMRRAGATYEQIKEAGLYGTRQAAHKAVSKELKKLAEQTRLDAQEYVQLQQERMDAMMRVAYRRLQNGTGNDPFYAIDRILKIMDREAKLLGLDAPAKQELSGPGGGPIQTEQGGPDLSQLTAEELRQWKDLMGKAYASAEDE